MGKYFKNTLWGVLLTGFLGAAHATDFTVDQVFDGIDANPGDGICATVRGDCTLRAAVMETNALVGADTITIPSGTYALVLGNTDEDFAAEGDLDILDDLTVVGADPATTILTGNTNQFRVWSILKRRDNTLPVVSISSVTLTEGLIGSFIGRGAVLYNEGELTLDNVTVENASTDQVAVYNQHGSMLVNNSRIQNNYAGIVSQGDRLTVKNSSFSSNGTSPNGAAIQSFDKVVVIENSQFVGNSSVFAGGAVYSAGLLVVSDSSFDGNSVAGANDSAGGALWFLAGSVIDTSITNNTADWSGGGVFSGTVILKRVTLMNNRANRSGGAAYISASGLISDSVVTGNSAGSSGGGLYLMGFSSDPPLVRHTEISGNSAAYGGGVYTGGDNIKLENVTISGNSASENGGGLYHKGSFNVSDAVQLTHVTLAANTAPAGMGGNVAADATAGVVRLSNTLIAAAESGLSCAGTIVSLGYNLDSSDSCGLSAVGDQTNTDPVLDVLTNNGGDTRTYALLTGSPAIDAGNVSLCASRNGLDQRYFYRGDGVCDIGAYEAGSARAQSGTLAFSLANFSVNEIDGTASVTVSRTDGSEGDVSISLSNLGTGTANPGTNADYVAFGGTQLQWYDGDATDKTFDITINDDSVVDGDKTINLTLGSAEGGADIGAQNVATLTIVDDESIPGNISFDAAIYAVAEDGRYIDIIVSRLDGNAPVSIDYASSDNTAIAGTDYIAISGTLDFSLNQTSKTIRVYITNNRIYEGDKTFNLTLSNPQGGVTLGQWSFSVVTIEEDELQPDPSSIVFDVTSVNVDEAGSGVVVSLTRTGNTASVVSVDYATTDETAVAGSDYTAGSGTITFDAGVTSRTISLFVIDDAIAENTESFTVSLSNPLGGASLGTTQTMTVNIQDDDALPTPSTIAFDVASVNISEAESSVTVNLTRTGTTTGAASVDYATSDGTAVAGSDYAAGSGTVTFDDGVTSRSITLSINDDAVTENTESFTVSLSNPQSGASLGAIQAMTVSIRDDDTVNETSEAGESDSTGGGGAISLLLLLGGLLLVPFSRRRKELN